MNMKRRSLKILLAIIMTLVMSLTVTMPYAKAASVVPKLQMVITAAVEYHSSDRVSFTVASPNYSGKVEYRVILYNGTTKKTSELWPSMPGYYYKNWQPAGNYNFTINWPAVGMEPGAYSLTVLVRRVGANAAYDSFVKTNTFWIKTEDEISAALQETAAQETTTQETDEQYTNTLELKPSEVTTLDEEEKLSDVYYENIIGKYKIKLPENWIFIEEDEENDENNKNKVKYSSVTLRGFDGVYPSIYIFSGSGVKGVSFDTAKEMLYDSYIKKLSEDEDSKKLVYQIMKLIGMNTQQVVIFHVLKFH